MRIEKSLVLAMTLHKSNLINFAMNLQKVLQALLFKYVDPIFTP